jgi:hypothetical protein
VDPSPANEGQFPAPNPTLKLTDRWSLEVVIKPQPEKSGILNSTNPAEATLLSEGGGSSTDVTWAQVATEDREPPTTQHHLGQAPPGLEPESPLTLASVPDKSPAKSSSATWTSGPRQASPHSTGVKSCPPGTS